MAHESDSMAVFFAGYNCCLWRVFANFAEHE